MMKNNTCTHGHVNPKRTKSGNCSQCDQVRNKFRIKAGKTSYALASPEQRLWYAAKIRAKVNSIPFLITIEDIKIPEFCPVLGIKLVAGVGKACDSSPSLDKLKPHFGYITGNIFVISHRANTLKGNAVPSELRAIADWIDAHDQQHRE